MKHDTTIIGKRFGRLTVLERLGARKEISIYRCHCDCGVETNVFRTALVPKQMQFSCGCMRLQMITKHGMTAGGIRQKTWYTWSEMLSRCTNKDHKQFENYGGRGIAVCKRWMDFRNFLEDMGKAPDGLSIDRINNDGNYEPGNCRWTDAKTQMRNRRNTCRVQIGNEIKTLQEWSDSSGVNVNTLRSRYRYKWSSENLLKIPKWSRA